MIYSITVALMLVITSQAQAFLAPERPNDGEYISDTIDIIQRHDEHTIRTITSKLDREYRIPIIVVTIDSFLSYTDGEYLGIEAYSKKLFNFWRIGHAVHNYGVLVLIAKNDKIARIQLGGGWGFIYDDHAQKIMGETMIPLFEKNEFSEGITQGVVALDKLARTDLSFLIDSRTVALSVLLITLINALIFFVLIGNIRAEDKRVTTYCSAATGIIYLLLYIVYSFAILNHLEFLLTAAISLTFTLAFIMIYSLIYSRTHSGSETTIATLKLFGLMIFGVIALLVSLLLLFGNRGEYGDGTADADGGATGSWD